MKKLIEVAAGLAGGVLGNLFMQKVVMKSASKLPERHQARFHGDPGEVVLDKAEDLIGRRIPDQLRENVKPALQFTYGLTGPLVLGLVAERLGRGSVGRVIAAGAIMGAIVWGVGYLGWMPIAGVAEPIHRQPPLATATSLVGHAAYGVVSSLPLALAEHYV